MKPVKRLGAQRAEVAKYLGSLTERYGSHPHQCETPGQLEELLRSELRTRVARLLDEGVRATFDAEAEAAAQPPQWDSPYRDETFDADHAPVFSGRSRETAQLVEKLTQLLRFLRGYGVCDAARVDSTPADDLVAVFEQYLQHQQRLATPTTKRYTRIASQFLHDGFGRSEVDLDTLRTVDVIEFLQRYVKHLEPPALTEVRRERNALVPSLRAVPRRDCARTRGRGVCDSHVDYHTTIAKSDIARARATRDRQLRLANFARSA